MTDVNEHKHKSLNDIRKVNNKKLIVMSFNMEEFTLLFVLGGGLGIAIGMSLGIANILVKTLVMQVPVGLDGLIYLSSSLGIFLTLAVIFIKYSSKNLGRNSIHFIMTDILKNIFSKRKTTDIKPTIEIKTGEKGIMKITERKLTEGMIMGGFLFVVAFAIATFSYSFLVTSNQLSNVEKAASKEKVVIVTETGEVQKRKVYENDKDVALALGLELSKKLFSFDYKTVQEDNAIYIRNFALDNIFNVYKGYIEGKLNEDKFSKPNYKMFIKQYAFSQDSDNNFILEESVTIKRYTSDKDETSKDYYLKIKIAKSQPTTNNSLGFFMTSFALEVYNSEEHSERFQ